MAARKADLIRFVVGLGLIVGAIYFVSQRRQNQPEGFPASPEPAAPVDVTDPAYPFKSRWAANGDLIVGGSTMGRIPYSIEIVPGDASNDAAEQVAMDAYDALERVNRVMSAYLADSDLSRLNRAAGGVAVTLDAELFTLLGVARRHTTLTDGAFDPTARRLFQHWRNVSKQDRLPTEAELADLRTQSGWARVTLNGDDHTVTKATTLLQIDLGAIAKGYAVDKVVDVLKAAGMAGGLIEVGGEVRVFGPSPRGGEWILGITHPFQGALAHGATCGRLRVADKAVATSGNYRRFSTIGGKRYSHIVDPRTGWPVDAAPSVTVIAGDCTTADIWATALSVMGPDGLAKIEAIDGLEAMMIVGTRHDARTVFTSGFGAYLIGEIDVKPVEE